MKFFCYFSQLLFLSSLFFVASASCVDFDNYIHVDYIKKKYPEIDEHVLKAQATRDGQTAPIHIQVGPGILQFLSTTVATVGVITVLFRNPDKIEGWLQAISPKYPLNFTLGNATQNGGHSVSFGVPYYIFVPYAVLNAALIYSAAKR